MRRAKFWDFITLNLGWLGLSVMWNSLHVLLLPTLLLNFVPASQKNGILGIITAIGLFIAMVIQPFAGAMSDSWHSRFGRRRPLMLAGTLGDIVFLLILGYAGGIPAVVIGYIGLQFTSNHAHGAMQGLLPDRLAEDQMGRGSAVKNFFDMLGLIAASFGMGLVLVPGSYNITPGIYVVIAVLVVSMAITIFTTHEQSTLNTEVKSTQRHTLTSSFKIDWKANRTFAWLIAGRLIFLIGALGIQSFLLYFVRDTLPVPNPAAYAGQLTMLVGVGVVIAAFSSGFLTDRFGPRPVHFAAAGSILFGTMLLAFVRAIGIIPV
ncbi:MAG: SLC45 family MFS transporter, partial [Anaerolineaceae bacterium]|nr:SLC45 family MFS transporter [Anaerolineaceae bacterium]